MTNDQDLNQTIQPLTHYVATNIKCTEDHAQVLALKIITALPVLFSTRPEIFTYAIMSINKPDKPDPQKLNSLTHD